MKKTEWFVIFFPLMITWGIDRLTKLWALNLDGLESFGFFTFVLHFNQGAMLGLFSDLPAVLRVVSLSTGGAFLVCIYAIIQYLLPIKSIALRTGLSILLGGIIGNVTDRIIWGHVVDFIVIGVAQINSPAFNLADALQWVGYALIVYAIIKEGDLLWPENDARKRYWINLRFQLKYCFFLMGVGLGLSLIAVVFSYTYLRVTMIELIGNNPVLLDKFLAPFVFTFVLISLGFCAGLFAVGKVISHKIAGPLYAFEKFMDDSLAGKNRQFKLRAKDEFKHLEKVASRLQGHLIKHGALSEKQAADEVNVEQDELQGALLVERDEQTNS